MWYSSVQRIRSGFFAYPDSPSRLAPPDAGIHLLAAAHEDIPAALDALSEELGAPADPPSLAPLERPPLPTGALTQEAVWTALCALMPENAIISDEAVTSGRQAYRLTASAPPHDWLHVTGGSIGQGLPAATGAAVACPDRQLFAMEGGRIRHVHIAGALDPGARVFECRECHLRQPQLSHFAG